VPLDRCGRRDHPFISVTQIEWELAKRGMLIGGSFAKVPLMIDPSLSEEDMRSLRIAIDAAIEESNARKMDLSIYEIAARLFNAYVTGERDPAKLAEAVIFPIGARPFQ
jgi:hypothetical protein